MIKQIHCYLTDKPLIGVASGTGSGLIGYCYHFLTDEKILKLISACGIWFGFVVAVFTTIGKLYNLYKAFKRKPLI